MKRKVGLFFFPIILFTACSTSITVEPTQEIRNTPVQNTKVPPTSFITDTPIPLSPTAPIPMTAAQQVLHDKLDKYCGYGQAWGFESSPDDHWDVVLCSYDTIELVRDDEAKHWELSSDTLINSYVEYFVHVEHWSNDGNYVYVSFDPHTDGYWEPFHQGIVLYRLNLETGQISEVLPLGKSDWTFYSFAFSSNDRRLAYVVTDSTPVTLNIRDMQTGLEQSFEFDPKYNTGGGFVWSPDSQQFVFSVTQFDTSTYEYVATSIIVWDRETSEITELIKDHPSRMQAIEWTNTTKIILQSEIITLTEVKAQNYELNLANNELTEINP